MNRVAVVTGAGSGIARRIAVTFAAAGASVAILDVDRESGNETALEIQSLGGEAEVVQCDVSRPDQVEESFKQVDARFGRVDVLVNAAYVIERQPAELLPPEAWTRVLAVGVSGYFWCAQQAGRRMIERGDTGSIVNISSVAGLTGIGRGSIAYSVSKGAVNQLTRELAVEWASRGIRVNALLPGQVRTPGLASTLRDPRLQGLMADYLRGIPIGRLAEPEDVALAALFLASDASSMITGVLLPVDGGNLAMNAGATLEF